MQRAFRYDTMRHDTLVYDGGGGTAAIYQYTTTNNKQQQQVAKTRCSNATAQGINEYGRCSIYHSLDTQLQRFFFCLSASCLALRLLDRAKDQEEEEQEEGGPSLIHFYLFLLFLLFYCFICQRHLSLGADRRETCDEGSDRDVAY